MAKRLGGSEVVKAISADIQQRVAALKDLGVNPMLAIVRVGDRPDDIAYEQSASKRCQAMGVAVEAFTLPNEVGQVGLLALIDKLNNNPSVHGILLLRPLPEGFDDAIVRNAILAKKDVDGITDQSLAGVFTGASIGFPPCTAQACMEILDHYGVDCNGKKAVVIGRSLVVGKPAAMLLLNRNATVTICHSKTEDLAKICSAASILIVATGRQGLLNVDCYHSNQTVIDVGIHVDAEGKLCGDVEYAVAEPLTAAITPVPGGVGTVTTSVLVSHVVTAAQQAIVDVGIVL